MQWLALYFHCQTLVHIGPRGRKEDNFVADDLYVWIIVTKSSVMRPQESDILTGVK